MAAYAVKLEFAFLTDLHELLLQKGIVDVIFVLQVFMNVPEKDSERIEYLLVHRPELRWAVFEERFCCDGLFDRFHQVVVL